MPEVGSSWITVLPDMRRFNSGVAQGANNTAQSSGKSFSNTFAKVAAVGLLAFGAANIFGGFIRDAQESARVTRLTENAIKATGGAANVTASQVSDLSTSLSNKTAIDDELIQSGSNLILTFKNIRNEAGANNDIFNQATAAAVDLSAAGFGSIESASLQLGKALNDPLAGMTALSRSGITFTAQQKDQIKVLTDTGDLLGAQKIILGEIQSEVGGAATSAADPIDQLKVTMGNLGEKIGGFLLPAVEDFAKFVGDTLIPGVTGLFDSFASGKSTGDGFIGFMSDAGVVAHDVFEYVKTDVIPTLASMAAFVDRNQGAFVGATAALTALFVVTKLHTAYLAVQAVGGLVAYILQMGIVQSLTKTWTAVQWLLNAALSANPIGIVIAALVALGVGLYLAWTKSETFRNIVTGVWNAVRDAATSSWHWIDDKVFTPLKAGFGAVGTKFVEVKDWIGRTWEEIKGAASTSWKWINDHVFAPFKAGIATIGDAFSAVSDFIGGVWDTIIGVVSGAVNAVIDVINFFLDGINTIASAVGFDLSLHVEHVGTVNFSASQAAASSQAAGRTAFADGGVYPGYTPGRDIGYIGVSGGEAIMRPEWTRAVETYNPGYVDAANAAARSGGVGGVAKFLGAYATGGTIESIMLGQFPTARMTSGYRPGDPGYHGSDDARDFGGPTPGDSAFMLMMDQWWAGYYPNSTELIHTGPGSINLYHGQPHTYDASTQAEHVDHVHVAMENLDMLGGSLGSRIPGSVDTAVTYARTKLADAAKLVADPIKDQITGLTSGSSIMGVVGAAVNKTIDAVVDAIAVKEQSFSDSAAVSGISQSYAGNVAIMQAEAAKFGWGSGAQWDAQYNLTTGESGFNNTAQNPTSTAYGLGQFLDSTWAGYGPKTSDPTLQSQYMLQYEKDRYGDPSNAYSTWLSRDPHWYDQGGRFYPGAVGVNVNGGVERVLTHEQNAAFERLVDSLDRKQDGGGPVRIVGKLELVGSEAVIVGFIDREKVRAAIDRRSTQRVSR